MEPPAERPELSPPGDARPEPGHVRLPSAWFRVARPLRQTAALVVASPHSGRTYPPALLAQSRLDLATLRRAEDFMVDALFEAAPACGAPLIAAEFPRSFLDVNREPYELNPEMFDGPVPAHVNAASPRVRMGFGTVPQMVAGGREIYRGKLAFAEAERRIAEVHRPYHHALAVLLAETLACFGSAMLLDAHSMPSSGAGAAPAPDIVLGDRFGRACDARLTDEAERLLRGMGYRVRRNDPYAGGFTTEHYGRPARGVHALQVEINRALYMDEANLELIPRAATVQADMRRLMAGLADLAAPALAAE